MKFAFPGLLALIMATASFAAAQTSVPDIPPVQDPAGAICMGNRVECEEGRAKTRGFEIVVLFDLNSAELQEKARSDLRTIAAMMNDERFKEAKFTITGHADARGPDQLNIRLSQARARAVADFLASHDIDPQRIVTSGAGTSDPRWDDPRDPANRRVEVRLGFE